MSDLQNIELLLSEHDLQHRKGEIIASLKNSIKMELEKVDEANISIGASKLGGNPDLPDSIDFPKFNEGYLAFMGQINLAEVKSFDKDHLLPENGILYLFYDAFEQPWGFEGEDDGCFKILHFEGDLSELKRREYPVESEDFFPLPACKVHFKNMYTITDNLENLEFDSEDEEENFWNFRQDLMQPTDEEGNTIPAHYLLGEPNSIQNNVFEELYENNTEPILLFQIDSDEENLGVMWGDCGMLYFCIPKEQLHKKQFDKATFTLQCY